MIYIINNVTNMSDMFPECSSLNKKSIKTKDKKLLKYIKNNK